MLNEQQTFGLKGESLAVRHLKKQGYRIIAENYRTRFGEIDIIAEEGGVIAFIEVKSRKSRRYGSPKAAIHRKKMRTMSMVALHFLKSEGRMNDRARFDVVAIDAACAPPAIQVIRNAFELAYG